MSSLGRVQWLYHYFERATGPFRNLSDLSITEAQQILDNLKRTSSVFAAQRYDGYLQRRHELERLSRRMFMAKGGHPKRLAPHYMVVGQCPWLQNWYADGVYVRAHVSEFPANQLSFSYGDLFPTFSSRVTDGREYRQQIYTLEEIEELIDRYGFPQDWNPQGIHGPERYIEVQVWSDEAVQALRQRYHEGLVL